MKRLLSFFQSLFNVRHSIRARIFVCFSAVTIAITGITSLYWYQKSVDFTSGALVENMEKSITSSLLQIENIYEDIRGMHSTVIYETNSLNYITRDSDDAPASEWFESYNRLYTNLRTMNIILSRSIAGTGVYKADGSTCITGTMTIEEDIFQIDEVDIIRRGGGNDMLFFMEKPPLQFRGNVTKYIYVGRSIIDKGQERAIIVTRLSESALNDIFYEAVYPEGFVLLMDRSGDLLYDSSPGEFEPEKVKYLDEMRETGKVRSTNGFTVFTTYSEYTGLTIISTISDAYIKESSRALRTQLLILIILIILVVAVISLLVSSQITSGLQRLSNNMKLVGDGSMTSLEPIQGEDEVGRLSKVFIEMTDQIQRLLKDVKDNEQQKRMMEIKVLRAQISPHFLYNSLNTINYLAMLQNAKNIHILTASLIDLLQGAVNIDDVLIGIMDEVKYIRSYINIQQYRFPHEIRMEYQIDPQIQDCKVPKMILQPIVENAIIHGLREEQTDATIQLKAYTIDQETLVFRITDNGIGMSPEKIRQVMQNENNQDKLRFSGIGISNVDSRIKLQFGDAYGVTIYSRENLFTTVEIALPIVRDSGKETEND